MLMLKFSPRWPIGFCCCRFASDMNWEFQKDGQDACGRRTTSFHDCGSCWTSSVGIVWLRHHRQLTTTAGLSRLERVYVPVDR